MAMWAYQTLQIKQDCGFESAFIMIAHTLYPNLESNLIWDVLQSFGSLKFQKFALKGMFHIKEPQFFL